MNSNLTTKIITSGSVVFSVLAGLGTFTSQVQAADFRPPSWRGGPLTTVQEWEFDSPPPGPLTPDGDIPTVNPGVPTVTGTGDLVFGSNGVGDNYWGTTTGTGTLTFDIPNYIDTEERKDMWVQVTVGQGDTFVAPGPVPGPNTWTIDNLNAVDPLGVTITPPWVTQILNPGAGFDDTLYDFYLVKWNIFPNPDSESFDLLLGANTEVYEVVVDTQSTPEPTSILGFSALALLGTGATLKRKLKPSQTLEK